MDKLCVKYDLKIYLTLKHCEKKLVSWNSGILMMVQFFFLCTVADALEESEKAPR